MSSMTKLEHYVYKSRLLKNFSFWPVPYTHHESLHKAALLASFCLFCTSSKTQNFLKAFIKIKSYPNFLLHFSLQYRSIFYEPWCNFHVLRQQPKKNVYDTVCDWSAQIFNAPQSSVTII